MRKHLIHARRLALAVAAGLFGACLAAGAASAATTAVAMNAVQVAVGGFEDTVIELSPAVVNIHAGDTVMWLNNTSSIVGAIDLTSGGCQISQVLGEIGPGQSLSHQFTSPGTYTYVGVGGDGSCSPSTPAAVLNAMSGQVVVTGSSGGSGPASGQGSAALNATVSVASQFKSVTLSASSETFGNCVGGSSSGGTLGFPNGVCQTPSVTVTNNGTVPETLDVQGANATPSDSGTAWTLIAPGGSQPGQDQFELRNPTGFITPTPAADGVAGTLQPNGNVSESVSLIGPSASTDTSSSFSTTLTWTAL
jgi:plastocyanin